MGTRRARLTLSLVATAVYVLAILLRRQIPSQGLLFSAFFLYIVLLPGWLAARRLAPWATGALRTLLSFVIGSAISFVIIFAAAIFDIDLVLLGILAPVIVLGLAISKERAIQAPEPGSTPPETPGLGRVHLAILIVILFAVAAAVIIGGDPLLYTSDSADHLAYIRTISRTHEAFPEQFYYRDGGSLTRDVRKGMGQALWGALNLLTGRHDALPVWPLASFVSSAFAIISLVAAGLVLFRSAGIGIAAGILFVLFYDGGLRGYALAAAGAGYPLGRSFYVAALAYLPAALARERRGALAIAALASVAATMSHVAHFMVLVFVAAVFVAARLLPRDRGRRVETLRRGAAVIGVLIAANAPYLVFRYTRDYAPANPLHTHLQGALVFTEKLYVLNPLVWVRLAGPLGLLSVVALFVLWRKGKSDENLRLLLWGVIATFALLFVPVWYPFLFRKLTYLLARFEFAVPSMLVCAYLLRELWMKARRERPELGPLAAGVAFIAACALLAHPLIRLPADFAYSPRAFRTIAPATYRNVADLYSFVERACPPGSVVASDPITSFGIPAFTDAFVVCPYDQHATPNDSTAERRIVDCRTIFNPWAPPGSAERVMETYGATHLVVNGRIPPSVETMYWKSDQAAARELIEKLRETPSPLRIVFEEDGVAVAELVARSEVAKPAGAPRPLPFVGDPLDSKEASALPESGIPGIRIVDAAPVREAVTRGDTVTVRITWLAERRCPFAGYVAYLRFDTALPGRVSATAAFGKPGRKIVEALTRKRYRFRADYQPFGGVFPPDEWPLMREVRDRLVVAIPRDAAPGRYRLSLKLAEKTQYPNYVLTDMLADSDVYSGSAVGSILIQ